MSVTSCTIKHSIVLIGMMGAGKTAVGRRLARRLGLPFVDADEEVTKAAGMSIEEIFERYGEPAFREVERRVICRILAKEPAVVATGGGAFMDTAIRTLIREKGVSVWLKAELDTLLARTSGRGGRPLLRRGDPRTTLQRLMAVREPVYAEADITVVSTDGPIDLTVDRVLEAVKRRYGCSTGEVGTSR